MNVYLLFPHRIAGQDRPLPPHHEELGRDLQLNVLLAAMANGDTIVHDVARQVLLASLTDPDEIIYRQHVLGDLLRSPAAALKMYTIACEAVKSERFVGLGADSPDVILSRSVTVMESLNGHLATLRDVAVRNQVRFRSAGMTRLCTMLRDELDDEYFSAVDNHLNELKLRHGLLMSAGLGDGNGSVVDALHRVRPPSWRERILGEGQLGYSFQIPDRDEAGHRALRELRAQGISLVAGKLAHSVDQILDFFTELRTELAFYIGCLTLHGRLVKLGEPISMPEPLPPDRPAFSVRGLYDPCLSLDLRAQAVGNDVDADGKALVMITGANHGGKSTFLRGVGVAQLMMQAGMFTPAAAYRANICDGIFTHFTRSEVPASGKLDEELARMNAIADRVTPHSMLLCNESFASTSEREGSEIARQVVAALTGAGVKVVFVTHLHDLAASLYRERLGTSLFLRADPGPDGKRTFKLTEGEPQPTSNALDLYRHVIGEPA